MVNLVKLLMCRSTIKRSLSDGNILCDNSSPIDDSSIEETEIPHTSLPGKAQGSNMGLSDSTPVISTCESNRSYSRYVSSSLWSFLLSKNNSNTYCTLMPFSGHVSMAKSTETLPYKRTLLGLLAGYDFDFSCPFLDKIQTMRWITYYSCRYFYNMSLFSFRADPALHVGMSEINFFFIWSDNYRSWLCAHYGHIGPIHVHIVQLFFNCLICQGKQYFVSHSINC